MPLLRLYARAIALLAAEKWLSIALALASIAIAIVQLAEPVFFGRVVDALSRGEDAAAIIFTWAGIGMFGIVAGVVVSTLADRMAHRRRTAVLSDAFDQAMTLPPSYHASRGSGGTVTIITRGTEGLFWLWLRALREQLTALVGVVFLIPTAIGMDSRMAVILGILALAYLGLNLLVIARTTDGQNRVEMIRSDVSSRVVDVIGNVAVVQSFARFAAESSAMRSLSGKQLMAQYPVLTWWGVMTVLQRAAATITMVAVFAAGAMLAHSGSMTVGEIVSFVGLASLLISKLDLLSAFLTSLHQGAPSLETFFALLDEKAQVSESPAALPLADPAGEVSFEHVTFRYPGSNLGIFDIAFRVRPGATLAIAGPTGSGKSTIFSLLQRLRAPEDGRIVIGGQDIAETTLASLRQAIGVVFQDASLFNRSIAENIRIGKPGATNAEVERAARLAEAHEFIRAKPGGYDFVIGERGAFLSGGERQRLAIARAILKDAPILLLDEATSALDAETEAKIKRALDTLRQGRTTFIIAHRLSTVANADEILVIDQGHIVERGTYRDLCLKNGLFARMVMDGGFTVPMSDAPEVSLEEAALRRAG